MIFAFARKEDGDAFVAALRKETAGCIALPFFDRRQDSGLTLQAKNTWSEDGLQITIRKGYSELLIYGDYL